MKLNAKLYEKKIQKEKLEKEVNKVCHDLNLLRGDMLVKVDSIKTRIKSSENSYNQILSSPFLQITEMDDKVEQMRRVEQVNYHKEKHEKFSNECMEEIKDIEHFYNKKVKVKNDEYIKRKNTVNELEKEIIMLKAELQRLSKEQKIYYQHLLIQGYDVRTEGIVWIVRRLIELNQVLEVSMFPKFMDISQIEYVINLAYSQIEATQLKIILKALKSRQKNMRDIDIESAMMTSYGSSFFNNTNSTGFMMINEEHLLGNDVDNIKSNAESKFGSINIPVKIDKINPEENPTSNIITKEIEKKLQIRNKRLREELVKIYEKVNKRTGNSGYANKIFSNENIQNEDVMVRYIFV